LEGEDLRVLVLDDRPVSAGNDLAEDAGGHGRGAGRQPS
jgi:hypothetical protein